MPRVDVVIVSYNSRDRIRDCVSPLVEHDEIAVTIVDNDSPDRSLEVVADLPVRAIQRRDNLGFAFACNVGLAAGDAPVVLFLNPDARADPATVLALADAVEQTERVGAVGPLIRGEDGEIHLSQRRFSTPGRELSAALFVPRVWPSTPWSVDVGSLEAYRAPGSPEWVSGACLAARRRVLDELGGFDDRFFMYCEDMDLCRRLRDAGYEIRFEPSIEIVHAGGASAPRDRLIPVMTESRILYAAKHGGRRRETAQRAVTVVGALTHAVLTTQGGRARRNYLRALRIAVRDGVGTLGRDANGMQRRLPEATAA